jgi:predicted signal transduction protein with EAL and GGDEF domain
MAASLRPGDVVARLGGDEFMVIGQDVSQATNAIALAERLLKEIVTPIDVEGRQLNIRASVGIALARSGDRPSDVLSRADLAVYQAKQARSRIHLFDESLQQQVDQRYEMEAALTAALRAPDELLLHYQPIVDTTTGRVHAVEALLRWNRPGHGPVSPAEFIPVAEASSLVIDVDRWVLRHATAQLAEWHRTLGDESLNLSVNISGRHLLHESLVANIRDAIDLSGIAPCSLTIEVTESVLLEDLACAARQLDAVRALGVRVSIDDFGTGYTSIAHLHELPIDTLKVDRSFVTRLPSARERTLVETLVDLAHNLDLPVVAEGVETQEQMDVLEALGCEWVQGYLISEPRPGDEIVHLLAGDLSSTFTP